MLRAISLILLFIFTCNTQAYFLKEQPTMQCKPPCCQRGISGQYHYYCIEIDRDCYIECVCRCGGYDPVLMQYIALDKPIGTIKKSTTNCKLLAQYFSSGCDEEMVWSNSSCYSTFGMECTYSVYDFDACSPWEYEFISCEITSKN